MQSWEKKEYKKRRERKKRRGREWEVEEKRRTKATKIWTRRNEQEEYDKEVRRGGANEERWGRGWGGRK